MTVSRKRRALGRSLFCVRELAVIKSMDFPVTASSSSMIALSCSRDSISVPLVSIRRSMSLSSRAVPPGVGAKQIDGGDVVFLCDGGHQPGKLLMRIDHTDPSFLLPSYHEKYRKTIEK